MARCMEQNKHKITTCISSNNNLEYLKLAVKSVRQNAYYKDQPIVIHAENCTDGTDEWLMNQMQKDENLKGYIEHNDVPRGIGGGMDFCVDKSKTEFVNIIHSDMWVAPNQDLELLKLYDNINENTRLIASSFRIQPKIFPNDPEYRPGTVFVPIDGFGAYHNDFDNSSFDEWAKEFSSDNDINVRKGGGAGFFCRKKDYEFKMIPQSVVWHFSARGSHFRDEAKDNFNSRSQRQTNSEQANIKKFINKWGCLPEEDKETFVKPIIGTKVKTRL